MKKKIIGIFVCGLFLVSAYSGATNISQNDSNLIDKTSMYSEPPAPECIVDSDFVDDVPCLINTDDLSEIKMDLTYDGEIAEIIQRIDASMIQGYLKNLTAFGPRVTSKSACQDAGIYIYNEFFDMGLDVQEYNWSYEENHGTTIEATLNGVNTISNEIYIICAHYDSVSDSPGADDDGSGVAAVLSAAEIMSQYNFNHTVKFVAFDGEELGLVGSYYYVYRAYERQDNIVAALNADMIGYTSDHPTSSTSIGVFYDDNSLGLVDYTSNIAQEYYDFIQLTIMKKGSSSHSDHYRFWEKGYRAIFYIERVTTPYYHTKDDTIAHMDVDYNARVAKLIIATLCALAKNNAPYKPSTPSGPVKGEPGAVLQYSTATIDPDGDQVFYWFDWGDGNNSGWLGPYTSGSSCDVSYNWTEKGNYNITVKAKDVIGSEGPWSDPLPITMPYSYYPENQFLELLFERFPNAFPILRQLMGY